MFRRSLFVLLAIALSVLLWFTDSDYPFGIFKLFEFFDQINMKIFSETAVNLFQTRLGLSLGGLLFKIISNNPTSNQDGANVKKGYFLVAKIATFSTLYKLKITKVMIYTTQTTLLTYLKLQNTVNTNGYQGNSPHNTNHSSNKKLHQCSYG